MSTFNYSFISLEVLQYVKKIQFLTSARRVPKTCICFCSYKTGKREKRSGFHTTLTRLGSIFENGYQTIELKIQKNVKRESRLYPESPHQFTG